MTVTAKHPQHTKFMSKWTLTEAVVDGDAHQFIRDVDTTGKDAGRNVQYKNDAILTNFTARTKHGLVGAAFSRPPEVKLPTELDYLTIDATGNSLSLDQLAQELVGDTLEAGRVGLLIEFSENDLELPTKAELENIDASARISKYTAAEIGNWHTSRIGSQTLLDLIVLEEIILRLGEDGFTWIETKQFRVLRLQQSPEFGLVYTQEVLDEHLKVVEPVTIPLRDGQPWSIIPFVFIGSENNDSDVDNIPLYDLARLNIGHLKNSADYEESVHIVGQPTLFFTTDHDSTTLETHLPNGITMGSRAGYNLGAVGSATLVQPAPNQLADVAMQRKEQQAVMTGARLITPATTNTTAEEARMRHASEVSVLDTIVNNVSKGLKQAIIFVGQFMAADTSSCVYNINTQFFDVKADPNEIMAELQLLASGVIAQSDMRKYARENGLIDPTRTDEEIEAEISSAPAIAAMSPEQQEEDKQDQEE